MVSLWSGFVDSWKYSVQSSFSQFGPFFYADESADWEKELQQELQEYEVVTESNKDDQWDQEIEKMLQADDS